MKVIRGPFVNIAPFVRTAVRRIWRRRKTPHKYMRRLKPGKSSSRR
jgi:hypothetical protein